MAKHMILLSVLLILQLDWVLGEGISRGTEDGTEEWGYIDVREGAHMFWWLYYHDVSAPASVPLVLWLQGGPGASGTGYGNFEEVGPLFTDLTERQSTWVNVAHMLFVDCPVGTGFSYVDNSSLLTTTNKEVSDDLISFFKSFFQSHEELKAAPFYIVAESYGGKFASEVGVAIYNGISEGDLEFNFQGVALGDTWVSPLDFLFAWGPLLKSVSLVDEVGNDYLNSIAEAAKTELGMGQFKNATTLWGELEDAILNLTDNVDFYNFLKHEAVDSSNSEGSVGARHLKKTSPDSLNVLMNGIVREKLGIVPSSITWGESSGPVFRALYEDFMLDTIDKVDELLALGVNVSIYSGQLDLICCTTGTEAWVQKLKWPGLAKFNSAKRGPLYCGGGKLGTQAFVKKYENLAFYWIMNAGHMVPSDNPCSGLQLLRAVTSQSFLDWNVLRAEKLVTEDSSLDWNILGAGKFSER